MLKTFLLALAGGLMWSGERVIQLNGKRGHEAGEYALVDVERV